MDRAICQAGDIAEPQRKAILLELRYIIVGVVVVVGCWMLLGCLLLGVVGDIEFSALEGFFEIRALACCTYSTYWEEWRRAVS